MSFIDDVRTYLQARLGVSTAWPIYKGFMPDDQAQCIGIFPTGGYPATELNRETRNPTFQSRVRGARGDYGIVEAKWYGIFNALQDAQQISGSPILLPGVVFIQAMNDEPMEFGDSKYLNMICNWRAKRLNV